MEDLTPPREVETDRLLELVLTFLPTLSTASAAGKQILRPKHYASIIGSPVYPICSIGHTQNHLNSG